MYPTKIIVLVGLFYVSKSKTIHRPNLPLVNNLTPWCTKNGYIYSVLTIYKLNINCYILLQGEYRFVFHTVHPCETTQNQKLRVNLYLSKKARNITEIKGNLTFQTLLDDSLIVSLFKMYI